jgi:ABC-2 type transport system ATP-binding protein/lipopolysaccharide transport system ATP-binding protein
VSAAPAPTAPQQSIEQASGKDAVWLEGISVRYRVPHERITSFKEYAIRRLMRRVVIEDFWALRDVSLSVRTGEVFGIVGRNGAGKSTLLRVIARVLRPTRGRVRVVGHVAPLLEVGAGFHPELTGRENVYLNATLLGHTRREVEGRFNSIVEFSELEEFIDAPLRTYSSGMWARLGFAVATAWHPDILLMDEVLSVGDEGFRMKCEARIKSFRDAGTTVLLVSHSLDLIRGLCRRALWLERGAIVAAGEVADVAEEYHRSTLQQ